MIFQNSYLVYNRNYKMKILCVLYPDLVDGYPKKYPRTDLPLSASYPNGDSLPSPKFIDFTPGALLGCISGELGLRPFLVRIHVKFIRELLHLG
jgi:hypothetical protein